jgi:hypothetical protein
MYSLNPLSRAKFGVLTSSGLPFNERTELLFLETHEDRIIQTKIIETDFAAFIFRLLGFIASQIRETKIQ